MTKLTENTEVERQRRVVCGICPAGCWVRVTYDSAGKMCEVQPDGDSELGMICDLGRQSPQIVYSPDRLRHPLLRTGPKGRYEFKRITWDEAFDIIVARLNSTRPESRDKKN